MTMRSRTLALLVTCVTGCSFLTVERLEFGYRRETLPKCSTSVLPVLADGAFTLLWAAGMGLSLEIARDDRYTNADDFRAQAAILGVQAGVNLASMIYGSWQRRRCNGARDEHENWILERTTPEVAPPGPPGSEIEP